MMSVRRWWSVLVAGLLSWALVVSLLAEGTAKAADPVAGLPLVKPSPLPVGADGLVPLEAGLVRPNWTSASVTARAVDKPVEVLSERTESRRLWVWPDGQVQVEQAGGPVRFKDESATKTHGWSKIDTTLQRMSDGSIQPAALPTHVQLGKGTLPLVSMRENRASGSDVTLALPGVVLPEPLLEGSTARYRDVIPGVDATLEVRATGFELLWVVKDAAAADALNKQYGSGDSLVLPTVLGSNTTTPSALSDGSISLVDNKGRRRGVLGAPAVWDAAGGRIDPRGRGVKAAWKLGAPTRSARSQTARASVTVPKKWLSDPARKFPVTIDPTYQMVKVFPIFDTFVQQGWTTDQSASSELKVGNNGEGQVARSYLNFDGSIFRGKKVTSASVSLMQKWSYSCTARPWSVYDAGAASTSTRWTSQPSIGARRAGINDAKGFSATCPMGRSTMDITAQAQAWADANTTGAVGMMLRADNEADPLGWKRFYSNDSAYPPVIGLYYNTASGTPATPNVQGPTYREVQWTSATPKLSGVVPADRDGDLVKLQFARFTSATTTSSPVTLCDSGSAAGGATVSCTSAALPDNTTVWIRARAWDGRSWSSWSSPRQVTVANSTPNVPTMTCSVPNGGWLSAVGKATCTVTATGSNTSAPLWIAQTVNGVTTNPAVTQPTSTKPQTYTFQIGGAAGKYTVSLRATSPIGKQSAALTYSFGMGSVAITSPKAGTTPVTTDRTQITLWGPRGATPVTQGALTWRVAGAPDNSGWAALPAGAGAFSPTTNATGVELGGLVDLSALVGVTDGNGVKVPSRTAVTLEVRGCLVYDGVSKCATTKVVRVPHAYGSAFPTTTAGPVNIALWTGEAQVSETDATYNAPGGSLAVSRTYSSLAGPATDPANQVFGPGWTSGFTADESGLSRSQVEDNTGLDATLLLVDEDGEVLVFTTPDGKRRTTTQLPAGTYPPATEDTKASGLSLQVSGSGAATRITVTDEDGVQTIFTQTKAPTSPTGEALFQASEVIDKVTGESSTYGRDSQGLITRILAAPTDGVTGCQTNPTAAGCRSLTVTYTTVNNQTRAASITAWNGPTSQTLTTYRYDPTGRLIAATESLTGLTTTYTYDATGRLVTVTPRGSTKPFTLHYTAEKLTKVTRAQPDGIGGEQQVAAIVAMNDLSTITPSFNLDQFNDYQLSRTATRGFAVFGPDRVPAATPTAADWLHASVFLTDAEGYTIHEGSIGAGRWQLSATSYDQHDNVVMAWDARAVEAIWNRTNNPEATNVAEGTIEDLATTTTYNTDTDKTAANQPYGDPGTTALSTLAPVTWVSTSSGERVFARVKTVTTHDQGAPNSGLNPDTTKPWLLATTRTTTLVTADGATIEQLSTTTNDYSGTSSGAGAAKTGWQLGTPTSVTVGGITRKTGYDGRGRVILTSQPLSNGADAGTRRTIFYTADSSAAAPACRNKPAWAGLECQAGPVNGQLLPTTTTTYDNWFKPVTQTITSADGSITQTTTTSYDAAWRPIRTKTVTTGLTNPNDLPETTTTYDPTSGLIVKTANTSGTITHTHDQWGRETSYTTTPASGPSSGSQTTFNALGQVTTIAETHSGQVVSTKQLGYDGTDANGSAEHRGLVTSITYTTSGRTWTARAAYDAQGLMTTQKLPGGITKQTLYDTASELVSQSWTGPVTDPDSGAVTPDQPWLGWSSWADGNGRVVREWIPEGGAALAGQVGATPVASDLYYSYDPAGRLVSVRDLRRDTSAADAAGQTDPTSAESEGGAGVCTTRQYWYDANGNRTGQATNPGSAAGGCQQVAGPNVTRAYDTADRPITGANGLGRYSIDGLGRQTLIPSSDSPTGGADIGMEYWANDGVKTITQGASVVSYTLDGAGRRLGETTTWAGGGGAQQVVRHYSDGSDNPSSVTTTTAGGVSTSRLVELGGEGLDLRVTVSAGQVAAELMVASPRGDVVSTIEVDAQGSPEGLSGWSSFDEHGNPADQPTAASSSSGGVVYGWLGAHQRATTAVGLTLMGARVHNPVTGLFTSLDPVRGGGDTTYGYPNDPINNTDLDGQRWRKTSWKKIKKSIQGGARWLTDSKWGKRIQTACSFAWGHVGTACNVVYAGAYIAQGRYGSALSSAIGARGSGFITRRVRNGFRRGYIQRNTRYLVGPVWRKKRTRFVYEGASAYAGSQVGSRIESSSRRLISRYTRFV